MSEQSPGLKFGIHKICELEGRGAEGMSSHPSTDPKKNNIHGDLERRKDEVKPLDLSIRSRKPSIADDPRLDNIHGDVERRKDEVKPLEQTTESIEPFSTDDQKVDNIHSGRREDGVKPLDLSIRSSTDNSKVDNIHSEESKEDEVKPLDLSMRFVKACSTDVSEVENVYCNLEKREDEDVPLDLSISPVKPITEQNRTMESATSRTGKEWQTSSELPGTSQGCGQTAEAACPSSKHMQTRGIQTDGSPHQQVTSHTIIGMSGGLAVDSTVIGTQEVHRHHEDGRFQNMCQSTMQLIKMAEKDVYVSTYAERSALRSLKQFGSIFIKGRSGAGKSRLGLGLLAAMQSEGELQPQKQLHSQIEVQTQRPSQTQSSRTPVLLTSPAQWDLIPKDEGKYTVLIDDIFSSSNIIQSQVDDWTKCFEIMTPFVESGHIFIVITSRPEISANCENRLKRFSVLNNEIRLDDGAYELRKNEKIRMLRKICNGVTFDKKELGQISHMKTKLGFPQCCKYFSCSQMTRDEGLVFFAKPHAYILDDVQRIQECDGVGYLALVLVLMRNGCLSIKHLIQSQSDLLNRCQQYCRSLPERITPADVKHKLESLCGVYLRKVENVYEFQHQSIYEAVFLSISQESPAMFIQHCPVQMLLDFVRTTRSDEDTSDTVVCIDREYYDELADRITQLLLSAEHVHCVVNHPCLKEDSFGHFLVDRWIKKEYVSCIITTKVDPFLTSFKFFYRNRIFHQRTLLSLKVMRNLHTLVRLLLRNCNAEIKMDILPCAVLRGNNDIINSIIESGVFPDTVCFKALRCSGEIKKELTERIFNHVMRRVSQPASSLVDNAACPAGDKECQCYREILPPLSDVLLRSVLGENSCFIELVVDEIVQHQENSKSVFKSCLVQVFKDISGPYCVHRDITRNTVKIAKKLLGTGCDVDVDYLAWLAAGHPDAQLLEIILQMDVDIWKKHKSGYLLFNSPTMSHITSLEQAVFFGGYDCVKTLLSYIAIHDEVSTTKPENMKKDVATALKDRTLVGDTADVIGDLLGSHFLHWAAKRGDEKKLGILIDTFNSVDAQDSGGNTPLHEAVKSNSSECVKLLLASNASVNVVNCQGRIPLQCIEYHQRTSVDIIRKLLHAGSKLNCLDKNRNTVLHLAVLNNDVESVRLLVEQGADVNGDALMGRKEKSDSSKDVDRYNTSVLHLACQYSDVEIVQILCEHSARMDVTDTNGDTVLHIAAGSHIDPMEKLQYMISSLDAKKTLLHKSSLVTGRTALFPAAVSGNEEVVEFLLDEGLDVNHIDKNGSTAMTYPCFENSLLRKEIVKMLWKKGADPFKQDRKGRTCLHLAAMPGRIDIMELLLRRKTDVCMKDKDGVTPIHYAVQNSDNIGFRLVQLLLETGADPSLKDKENRTPLHYAAVRGNYNCMRLLLGNGADPNVHDKEGRTPLHHAAEMGIRHSLKLLLDEGADPSVHDKEGRTPLHHAAKTGNIHSIKLLLEKGTDPCVHDKEGRTPLHYASMTGDSDILKMFLQRGVDLHVKDNKRKTALHYAAKTCNCGYVKLLLEEGADSNLQDTKGKTPLHYAARQHGSRCCKLLLEKLAKHSLQDKDGKTPIHYAAESGSTDSVQVLLDKGADPCMQDKDGRTALHHAAWNGENACIKLLLEMRADPSLPDERGNTALHYAVWKGSFDNISVLLEEGTDPNVQDKEGKTALHYATGNTDNLTLLLVKGADQFVQDNGGRTALHYAAWGGNCGAIELLLQADEIPVTKDKEGLTALHFAAACGKTDAIALLLEKKVDPHVKDNEGRNSLHFVAGSGNTDSITLLLDKGADLLDKDNKGRTAVHYASGSGNADAITLLLEKGADPHTQDLDGRNALHYAVWKWSDESVKLLLRKVEIVQDIEGKTALHYAAGCGNTDIVTLLLDGGADPRVQDSEGKTALHYAVLSGSLRSVQLLLNQGADPCLRDRDDKTALNYATVGGSRAIINLLFGKDVNPYLKDT